MFSKCLYNVFIYITKLMVGQVVKNFPLLGRPRARYRFLQVPATGPYREPVQSSPRTLFN
jgi:hypothetical protein